MTLDFRYRRLGYVALNVSDLQTSSEFYRDLVGLQPAGEAGEGESLFRCSPRHHDLILHQASEPGLRRIGWEMESPEDLARVRRHLESLELATHDVGREEAACLGVEDAFRVVEPHTGATLEYFHSFEQATTPFEATITKIERLGHVVLGAVDHARAERFFLEQLNFRASDRIEEAITFMRCFPNPLHHSLGLAHSGHNHFHHVNFMVTDVDDIGKAFWRMQKNDVPIVFGPGRHPPSESMFLYFLDPDGMTVEYSFGMEEFPEVDARPPRNLPFAPENMDYWGAIPDPRMGQVGAIESALPEDVSTSSG
ncbi:VOC family protein [Fodinicurvata sediminis]|uniref:VOC family protein n=1 Tax=Fodinicurvata sediminis TaxID=1121832 RepID=UPI0003B7A99E|nr:VOC family protein [Fodinicurvata sediminis]